MFLFGSDNGIILRSSVGEVLGYTLELDEEAYLGSSDGFLVVLMMSHLRVYCLRTHLDHKLKLY